MNRQVVIEYITSPRAKNIIKSLRPIFKDLPHLPSRVTEILVQIIPWLAIVGAVLSAIGGFQDILFAFGIGRAPLDFGNPVYWLVYGLLSLLSAYIAFLSFPLLRERNYLGWALLFWGAVLSIVMSALTVLFNASYVVGFVITTAISFYLTFEIEPSYGAQKTAEKSKAKVSATSKKSK